MNHTIKFGSLFFLAISLSFSSLGQTVQEDYLKAKDYFNSGEYSFAIEYFRQVSLVKENNSFVEYASFYYALSCYKDGQVNKAKSMWQQMSQKNSRWNNISEVYYWMAVVYFEEGDRSSGVLYASKANLSQADQLTQVELAKIQNVSELELLYYKFSDDVIVGSALADLIVKQPISARNIELLKIVVVKFELDTNYYLSNNIGESQIKDQYKVAVLLPFMFESLEKPSRTMRNKFVMDLYHGIEEAATQLNMSGEKILLYAYDTKRDSATTAGVLDMQELKSMDLIIGPLFPAPSQLVLDFSYKYKINTIHPLSTSSDIIGANPYSFLYKSSVETQALVAAQLAIDSVENKTAMVFYERNKKDSINAYTYAQKIQEEGFEIVAFMGVVDTTINTTYDLLTSKYEITYFEYQKDSILRIDSDRVIKERKSIKEKDVMEYYEEFFTIAPDSIGHIYVASTKALFASSYISALEIRNDSMVLIGRAEWRNVESLTFEEMERLGMYFIDPDYMRFHGGEYHKYQNMYLQKYKKSPSMNSIVGYELMYLIGNLMIDNGNYFQKSNIENGFVKGRLFQGVEYGPYNSNQYVPITKLVDSKLIIVNSKE
ncbi:MAG: hypothetical protein OCD76_23125 [Reichenbachiella sp.]